MTVQDAKRVKASSAITLLISDEMCTNLDVLMKNSLRYNDKKGENRMREEKTMGNGQGAIGKEQ